MKILDNFTFIIIAALTSGMGAASVNIAARFTNDPGDILGFFGGAIGAGSAVVGAIWLEHYKSKENENAERIRLKRDVVRFGKICRSFLEHPNDISIVGQALSIRQAWASLVRRHGAASILDGQFLGPVDAVVYWYDEAAKSIDELVLAARDRPSAIASLRKKVDNDVRSTHNLIYFLLTEVDAWKGDESTEVGNPKDIPEPAV